jgi:hypothetical protein
VKLQAGNEADEEALMNAWKAIVDGIRHFWRTDDESKLPPESELCAEVQEYVREAMKKASEDECADREWDLRDLEKDLDFR